jgi:hypothetical protein
MRVRLFLFIIIITALVIAGTAALFSVTGIASLFSGHFVQVAIMASALELGKIVITSFLYRYWKSLGKYIKIYLSISLVVLMIITSAGIFGYLSDSYQKTKVKYSSVLSEIKILETKKDFFLEEKLRYENRINILVEIRTSQEDRLSDVYLKNATTSAKRIESIIKETDSNINKLNHNIISLNDSISKVDIDINKKESNNSSGELGPLVYISNAFDTDMDTVVKFFILLLIFVFDPLAVCLIIAANIVYFNDSDISSNLLFELLKKKKNTTKDISESEKNFLREKYKSDAEVEVKKVKENLDLDIDKTKDTEKEKPTWRSANYKR